MIDALTLSSSDVNGALYTNSRRSYPISNRKRIELQLTAVEWDGAASGEVEVRAALMIGGPIDGFEVEEFLVEKEILAPTTLASGGPTNIVRVEVDNPGAQWLVVYSRAVSGSRGLNIHMRAYD